MIFSVTILGSGSALPTSKRLPSAHVLNAHERLFLIDCAEGTQMQLRKLKLRLSKIGHIFISHLHGDHTLGLFGLLSTYNLLGRESELHIYAHKELEPILWTNVDFFVEKLRYKLVFHALNPREKACIYEDDKLYVESIPLRHRIPACGFIFREKECGLNIRKELIEKYELGLADIASIKNGADMVTLSGELIPNSELTYRPFKARSYAYCSDTLYSATVANYVKDVDLLYHEATFAHDLLDLARQTGHTTAHQAAIVARDAGVGKLIIGHFSSRYKDVSALLNEAKRVFPNTFAANDGDTYSIPRQRL